MIDADQALHHAEVFADQLQTRGDARGELLSLELAAHRASTSAEARRLHREAQRIRDAHEALVWPAPLRDSYVQMRAGFVLRGGCDELFAADVPIELAVSVRETWTTQRRLEEVLPGLIEARRRGLALDQLRHVSPPRAAASLAQLPTLAAHEGRRLAIRALQLDGPVERFEALGQLLGLKRFCRDQPVDAEQLRTLAKLGLESLHIRTQQLDPAVLALLGPSLQTLDLHGFTGSLAPILALPRLRSLTLDHTPTPDDITSLATLARLEWLDIPSLADPAQIEALRAIRLRGLGVRSAAAELLPALASLPDLECFSYSQLIGERVDPTPILHLGKLGPLGPKASLRFTANMRADLSLPASIEELFVADVDEPIELTGTPKQLLLVNSDPRCLPASLLHGLQTLTLYCWAPPPDEFLRALPRSCPQLEQLDITCLQDWTWSDAQQVVAGLSQLRRLSFMTGTVATAAELARAFPDLSMSDPYLWPRSP